MKRLLWLLLLATAWAQNATVLMPTPKMQFFGSDGIPLTNGYVYTYISGTNTQQASYTDCCSGTLNPDPVPLDGGGFANIWLGYGLDYTIAVYNTGGVLQYSIDGVSGLSNSNNVLNVTGVAAYTSSAQVPNIGVHLVEPGGSTGAFSIALPSAVLNPGMIVYMIMQSTPTGTITIQDVAGANLLSPNSNSASYQMTTLGQSATFISDGTSWEVFSNGGTGAFIPFGATFPVGAIQYALFTLSGTNPTLWQCTTSPCIVDTNWVQLGTRSITMSADVTQDSTALATIASFTNLAIGPLYNYACDIMYTASQNASPAIGFDVRLNPTFVTPGMFTVNFRAFTTDTGASTSSSCVTCTNPKTFASGTITAAGVHYQARIWGSFIAAPSDTDLTIAFLAGSGAGATATVRQSSRCTLY